MTVATRPAKKKARAVRRLKNRNRLTSRVKAGTARRPKPVKATAKKKIAVAVKSSLVLGKSGDKGCSIMSLGREYFAPYQIVDYEKLIPDALNYRYSHILYQKRGKPLTSEELYEYLLGETGSGEMEKTKALAISIEHQGQITSPIIVVKEKKGYLILEGNRRWAAFTWLREQNPAGWSKVPCYVLPSSMKRDAIDSYLGILHVQGKDEWPAYAQGAAIHNMHHKHRFSHEQIANYWGKDKIDIDIRIRTYKACNAYMKQTGESNPRWTHFYELEKYTTKEPLSATNRKLINKAIADRKFVKCTHARQIPRILANKQAKKSLVARKGPDAYEVSMKEVKKVNPLSTGVFKSMRVCSNAMEKGKIESTRALKRKRGNDTEVDTLEDLVNQVVSLCKNSGRRALVTDALRLM